MSKDSVKKILFVAFALCVVCSVLVSSSAILLRSKQEKNALLDKRKNILQAAGLFNPERDQDKDVGGLYEKLEVRLIDLQTGRTVEGDAETYDFVGLAKSASEGIEIPKEKDIAGIKRRARLAPVYLVKEKGVLQKIILPVYGKGLWSTLYGFLALEADFVTVSSLSFYQHAETPGLGGEVDNPRWKSQWEGKEAFNESGDPVIEVISGSVKASDPKAKHRIDGLSGATITSRGVTQLVRYWLGDHGFKNFIESFKPSSLTFNSWNKGVEHGCT